MSVSMSRTIKTNPVLTWPERVQASTGQRRRATEELECSATRCWEDAETVRRRDGGTVGRWDRGTRDGGTVGPGRSGAGWIVIIFDLTDQPVCWLAGRGGCK